MAKRAPAGEEPYRPLLDPSVISAALTTASLSPMAMEQPLRGAKVVELSRVETVAVEVRGKGREAQGGPIVSEPASARAIAHGLVEKLEVEKRMLVTRGENMALERLVGALASRLNTPVKLSHVLRSLVALLLNAEAAVDRRAGEVMGLLRPANGDFKGVLKFERGLANLILGALRDAGLPREY